MPGFVWRREHFLNFRFRRLLVFFWLETYLLKLFVNSFILKSFTEIVLLLKFEHGAEKDWNSVIFEEKIVFKLSRVNSLFLFVLPINLEVPVRNERHHDPVIVVVSLDRQAAHVSPIRIPKSEEVVFVIEVIGEADKLHDSVHFPGLTNLQILVNFIKATNMTFMASEELDS